MSTLEVQKYKIVYEDICQRYLDLKKFTENYSEYERQMDELRNDYQSIKAEYKMKNTSSTSNSNDEGNIIDLSSNNDDGLVVDFKK